MRQKRNVVFAILLLVVFGLAQVSTLAKQSTVFILSMNSLEFDNKDFGEKKA